MKLYYGDKEIDLPADSESYSYEGVMVLRELTLQFSSCEFIEIPVGAHCEFNGVRYFLEKPENFTKEGKRNFRYTLLLSSDDSKTTLWKVRNPIDKRIKFPYTTTPREHVKLIVDCLNMHDAGWEVRECLEGETKTVNYNHTYILDGLNSLADLYKTEWEIDGKRVSLRKVEYNKENPLPLSYKGSSGSFKKGVGRESGEIPPEVILIEGTTKNIDFSKYGSETLLLPKGKTLEYNGRLYKTDEAGTCVMRADTQQTTWKEDSLDCSEIIPARYGTVSEVITVGAEKNFYDFKDASIPENLDYSKYRISGETATIIFQTGMLAGQGEFEIEQDENSLNGYVHGERRFKLVPQEVNGITMPNEVYKPSVRDKYAVFNIMLPNEYICDDDSQTGASWDMFREAAKYLFEHEDKEFTFNGTLNGIWAKKRWLAIAGKIKVGGYTLFSDEQFHPEGSLIRITGIKRYVNNPFKPDLELSNCSVATSISNDLEKITTNEVTTDGLFNSSLRFTKRRFRDAKETLELLAGALLNFSGSINPITVHTMAMLLGDESLQFRFVNNKTNPQQVSHTITYDNASKKLTVPAGIIQHMTLGIKNISSAHKVSEYMFWDMEGYEIIPPDADAYYLYAKVSKTTEKGSFFLSKTAYKLEEVSGYYHLLTGVLNSEYEGERSFVELYGFTEVLPGRITTDRVVSSDGLNFLDFVNNAFRVGNTTTYLDFNTRSDGKFRLKGILIQSESGEESFLGCFRGVYNSTYTYYNGDEVTYTYNGGTSTYRYIYSSPGKGYAPTNTSRWQLISSQGSNGIDGDDGVDGAYFEYRYAVNGSRTSPPSLSKTSTYPSGWVTEMPSVGSLQYLWCTVAKKSAAGSLLTYWSTPTRITGYDGIDGKDGAPGPALAFQGVYNTNKTYYGTSKRVDAVKYNGIYYVARVDAGNGFSGHAPTDANYWNEFGNQFESVATNLLLAEEASIGSWWHSGGKIVSTLSDGNKIILDAVAAQIIIESARSGGQSSLDTSLGSKITLDAANGIIEARGKNNTSRVAYMSPSGIFCNSANTQAVSSIYGSDVRAAIVGLGYGNVSRDDVYQLGNFLAGVYGVASNSGNAPAYGGYFRDLMAAGLILNRKVIESGGVYLNSYDTFVVGYSQNECSVYLPNDGVIGRIIFLKQRNVGSMKCYARGGQKIYDDSTVNSYFRVPCGSLVIAIFDRCYINNVLTEAWLVNSINTLIND